MITNKEIFDKIHNQEVFKAFSSKGIIFYDSEFIFYSDAMDYIQEQDQTLTYFLEAAGELGFNLKDMNSCQLASIGLYKELEDALQPVFQALEQD